MVRLYTENLTINVDPAGICVGTVGGLEVALLYVKVPGEAPENQRWFYFDTKNDSWQLKLNVWRIMNPDFYFKWILCAFLEMSSVKKRVT